MLQHVTGGHFTAHVNALEHHAFVVLRTAQKHLIVEHRRGRNDVGQLTQAGEQLGPGRNALPGVFVQDVDVCRGTQQVALQRVAKAIVHGQ